MTINLEIIVSGLRWAAPLRHASHIGKIRLLGAHGPRDCHDFVSHGPDLVVPSTYNPENIVSTRLSADDIVPPVQHDVRDAFRVRSSIIILEDRFSETVNTFREYLHNQLPSGPRQTSYENPNSPIFQFNRRLQILLPH